MITRTRTMAICKAYFRMSLAKLLLFAAGESGLASVAEFIHVPPFSSGRPMVDFEAAGLGDAIQPVNQLVERHHVLHELTRHRAPVEHKDAICDGIDVKDVVVNKDGGLA